MNKSFISFALACVLSANMLSIPAYASYDGSDAGSEGIGSYTDETGGDDESPGAPASPDAMSGTDGLEVTWNEVPSDDDLPLVSSFSDVKPGNWFYNDVMKCCQLGIVAGYTDGTFGPNQSVTGAQFVTMMCREFYGSELAKNSADAQFVGRAWYVPALYTGYKSGMLEVTSLYSGYSSDWKSSANVNLNRYEMALILSNILKDKGKTVSASELNAAAKSIKDYSKIPSRYNTAVLTCYSLGVITGMSDGTFSGDSTMTRAQSCTVSVRMLDLISPSTDSNNNTGTDEKPNSNTTVGTTAGAGLTITSKAGTSSGQPITRWNIADTNNATGTLSNGKAITESNVQEIVDIMHTTFPTGMTWSSSYGIAGDNQYDNPGSQVVRALKNHTTSAYAGCGGFASMISDAIFGKTANPVRQLTDASQIRTGDIVVKANTKTGLSTHVWVVVKVAGDNYYAADAGGNQGVLWQDYTHAQETITKNNAYASPTYTYYVYTRYPE